MWFKSPPKVLSIAIAAHGLPMVFSVGTPCSMSSRGQHDAVAAYAAKLARNVTRIAQYLKDRETSAASNLYSNARIIHKGRKASDSKHPR